MVCQFYHNNGYLFVSIVLLFLDFYLMFIEVYMIIIYYLHLLFFRCRFTCIISSDLMKFLILFDLFYFFIIIFIFN